MKLLSKLVLSLILTANMAMLGYSQQNDWEKS
jgi:hypothetical protein